MENNKNYGDYNYCWHCQVEVDNNNDDGGGGGGVRHHSTRDRTGLSANSGQSHSDASTNIVLFIIVIIFSRLGSARLDVSIQFDMFVCEGEGCVVLCCAVLRTKLVYEID